MQTQTAWIIGIVLLLVSFWLCALNATVFWRLFVSKVEAPSWIPLLGGVLGVFALGVVIPVEPAHRLCWLPLLLDYGSLPGILHALYAFSIRRVRARTN